MDNNTRSVLVLLITTLSSGFMVWLRDRALRDALRKGQVRSVPEDPTEEVSPDATPDA